MEPIQNSPYVFKDCCGNEIVDFFVAEREILQNYLPALSLTPVCKSLNKPYHLALIHQILNPYICKTNVNIKLVIVKVFKFLEVIGKRAVDVTEVTITKQNLLKKELGALAAKCENLQSLSIENCVWRDNIELGMFSSLKFLSKLVIENRTYNNNGTLVNCGCKLDSLVHLPSLKEISFKATAIDSTKLKVFVAGYSKLDITFPDGKHYAGSLKNGLAHGKGENIHPDGNEHRGEFEDGKFKEGRVKIICLNGNKYEGGYKNGRPHGTGKKAHTKNGVSFEEIGHYIDGKFMEGVVTATHANGKIYKASYKNGTKIKRKQEIKHIEANDEIVLERFLDRLIMQCQ